MNNLKKYLTIAAFSFLVLGLPVIASAQYRDRDRDDDRGRNDDYNNGRYGNNNDMRSIVRDLKSQSRELQRHLDRDLDNSRHDGTRREDQLNDMAKRFRSAVNRLSESRNGPREDDVQRVLSLGRQMDRPFSRAGLDYHIRDIWRQIEHNLDELDNSNGYDDNRNNRFPQGGNTRINRPSWWPF